MNKANKQKIANFSNYSCLFVCSKSMRTLLGNTNLKPMSLKKEEEKTDGGNISALLPKYVYYAIFVFVAALLIFAKM
jgi:hypothetical protein